MARKKARKPTPAQLRAEVIQGYLRLATGHCNDALKLLFLEQPTQEELAGLDIFNVSDIKRPRGGGLEIKFFDRCEALVRLEALSSAAESKASATKFYEALQRSVGNDN